MEPNNQFDGEQEKFVLNFRVLGNEIFSVELMSQSKRKNWIIFGILLMVILSMLFQQLVPFIETVSALFDGN